MEKVRYSCLICQKEAEKDRKKGFMPSIMAWVTWDSKKEIINHIEKCHPKEYKKCKEEASKKVLKTKSKGVRI